MTDFRLRTRRDQASPPSATILLDWFGDGSTIQVRQNLTSGLAPPAVAVDFFRFAGAVFCADRLAIRPGTWTRAIKLDVPVRDPDRWHATVDRLDGHSVVPQR